ncbi:hypothetical protein [Kibdelosporangium philippinense]|uniref:hypothetical protein n=1 Tax=Kibdelosporangium philippinense TaxID=211113 RepID=UPI00360952FE
MGRPRHSTVGTRTSAQSPTREYTYPWTNQWYKEKCNPSVFASPQQNDIDAALATLFASHNRMHDWSYHLASPRRPGTCRPATVTAVVSVVTPSAATRRPVVVRVRASWLPVT